MFRTKITEVMVGQPQPTGPTGELSAVRKSPVDSARLNETGLDGDAQVYVHHGGVDKALLHYARDHHERWRELFPSFTGVAGCFGENISTTGMTESTVCLGDQYRIGPEVIVEVSQPRQPCWKLGVSGGAPDIPRVMQEEASTGWYYRVLQAGTISTNDTIELISRPLSDWTLRRMILGFFGTPLDSEFLKSISELKQLASSMRKQADSRLDTGEVEDWEFRLSIPSL